jgi:hypothetical protein
MDPETRQSLGNFFVGTSVVVQPVGGHPATEVQTQGFMDSFTNILANVGDSLAPQAAAPAQDFWNTPSIEVPKLSDMLAGDGIGELGNIQPAHKVKPLTFG